MKIPKYDLDVGVIAVNAKIQNLLHEGGKNKIVLIAGGSASGKTSKVAVKVKEAFGDYAIIISADDYYRGVTFMNEQAAKGRALNWDQPEAVEMELLLSHLKKLKEGAPIEKPIYDFASGQRKNSTEKIEPTKVIIVEGLFVLDAALAKISDLNVFVEIGAHGRMIRRLFRDIKRTGQKPLEIVKYFAKTAHPMHEKYIEGTKKNAHLIILNNYDAEKEAGGAGMTQCQLKFRGTLEEEFLRKIGAQRLASVRQVDRYFSPTGKNFSKTDEIIRIREENNRIIFTYKGPKEKKAKTSQRPFIEFEIDKETECLFSGIYKTVVKTIFKNRTFYALGKIIFSLDSDVMKYNGTGKKGVTLGKFIEIREPQEDLMQALKMLGLYNKYATNESYFEM